MIDFFTMSRLCRFYHHVPKDDEKCYQGHYLCATLDCQVRNCKYTTRPFSMSDTKPSIEMMKLHMIGAHPNLRDAINPNEKDDDKKQDKVIKEPRQERDPNRDETCPKCFKIFFNKKTMKRHLRTQHLNLDRLECNDCSKTFASKAAVNYHVRKCHTSNSRYGCTNCDETFVNYTALKEHLKEHKRYSQHDCDKCTLSFKSSSNLNRHISEEHNIVKINTSKKTVKSYPYKCDKCNFFTKRKHYFEQHKIYVHSPESVELLPCEVCEKKFKYKQNLKKHMNKYHEAKSFVLDILVNLISDLQ